MTKPKLNTLLNKANQMGGRIKQARTALELTQGTSAKALLNFCLHDFCSRGSRAIETFSIYLLQTIVFRWFGFRFLPHCTLRTDCSCSSNNFFRAMYRFAKANSVNTCAVFFSNPLYLTFI
jgi:hypothetical protein